MRLDPTGALGRFSSTLPTGSSGAPWAILSENAATLHVTKRYYRKYNNAMRFKTESRRFWLCEQNAKIIIIMLYYVKISKKRVYNNVALLFVTGIRVNYIIYVQKYIYIYIIIRYDIIFLYFNRNTTHTITAAAYKNGKYPTKLSSFIILLLSTLLVSLRSHYTILL